jgi:hypothetical protein
MALHICTHATMHLWCFALPAKLAGSYSNKRVHRDQHLQMRALCTLLAHLQSPGVPSPGACLHFDHVLDVRLTGIQPPFLIRPQFPAHYPCKVPPNHALYRCCRSLPITRHHRHRGVRQAPGAPVKYTSTYAMLRTPNKIKEAKEDKERKLSSSARLGGSMHWALDNHGFAYLRIMVMLCLLECAMHNIQSTCGTCVPLQHGCRAAMRISPIALRDDLPQPSFLVLPWPGIALRATICMASTCAQTAFLAHVSMHSGLHTRRGHGRRVCVCVCVCVCLLPSKRCGGFRGSYELQNTISIHAWYIQQSVHTWCAPKH